MSEELEQLLAEWSILMLGDWQHDGDSVRRFRTDSHKDPHYDDDDGEDEMVVCVCADAKNNRSVCRVVSMCGSELL